jgi:putative salt-induced outer membrane protein YdiY
VKRLGIVVAAIIMCGISSRVWADEIFLKNGDKVTGRIDGLSKNELILATEMAGRVVIKWKAVASVRATTYVRSTFHDGLIVMGRLIVSEGSISIQQTNGTTAPIDLDALSAFDLIIAGNAAWRGVFTAGIELSRGNAQTLTVATNDVATRIGPHDRLGLFGTYLFSSVGIGANEVTTAHTARGGGRYDHDLVGALYVFELAEAETDALQLLDHRVVLGGGLGVHAFRTDMSQFNLFAGASFAADRYAQGTTTTTPVTGTGSTGTGTLPGQGGTAGQSAPGQNKIQPTPGGTPPAVVRTTLSRSVAEGLAGQDFFHQLSNSVGLAEALTFYTATTSTSDYRISFDLSLWAQLNGWLQWNLTIADRYLHIPPSGGALQNDAYLTTGLGITFGGGANGAYRGADVRPVGR